MAETPAPQDAVSDVLDDDALIRAAAGQDTTAIEELYRRHASAALSFARALVGNHFDADDVASEAFYKVVGAIQRGNGPKGPFRPYLLTAVKTCAADQWSVTARHDLVPDPLDVPVHEDGYDQVLKESDKELALSAFSSLPPRWQTVLWHIDVEDEPPRRVAPLLGIEANAVSAIAARARRGLRQAYLERYAASSTKASCQPILPLLAKSILQQLAARDERLLSEHLEDCLTCGSALMAMTDARSTMRRAVAPWYLGALAAGPLLVDGTGSGAGSGSGSFEGPKEPSSTAAGKWAVGAGAAVVAVLIATAAFALVKSPADDSAAPPQPALVSPPGAQAAPDVEPPEPAAEQVEFDAPTEQFPEVQPAPQLSPPALPNVAATVPPVRRSPLPTRAAPSVAAVTPEPVEGTWIVFPGGAVGTPTATPTAVPTSPPTSAPPASPSPSSVPTASVPNP